CATTSRPRRCQQCSRKKTFTGTYGNGKTRLGFHTKSPTPCSANGRRAMTDLYSEWRDFYAEKVRSWMSLEELRAECGKLRTVDSPSPEVLRIHAMHALEELQAEVERLRADRDSWEQQASDRVADWHAEHLRAEQLAEALRESHGEVLRLRAAMFRVYATA